MMLNFSSGWTRHQFSEAGRHHCDAQAESEKRITPKTYPVIPDSPDTPSRRLATAVAAFPSLSDTPPDASYGVGLIYPEILV